MQINFLSLGLVAIALIASSFVSAMPVSNRNDVYTVDSVISSPKKVAGTILRRDHGLFQRADEEADEEEDDEEEADEEEGDEFDAQTEANSEEVKETELKRRNLNLNNWASPTVNQEQSIGGREGSKDGNFAFDILSFDSKGGNGFLN